MNWISSLFPKHWRLINLSLIILLSLLLIIHIPAVNSTVSQAILSTLYYAPFYVQKEVSALTSEAERSEGLRATIMEMTLQVELAEEMARENLRLRSILGFEPPVAYSLVPAKVMSVEGGSYPIAVVINLGAKDGIAVDFSVINQQGLVGRITWVSDEFAHVQLLTDPANRVAARIAESREMGIVKTEPDGNMILDNFPVQGQVQIGDTVVSSGLGGVYPAGLVVGTVANVNFPEEEPFAEVDITPAANFFSIEEVFILQPMTP